MRVLLTIAPWSYRSVHPGRMGQDSLLNRLVGTVGGASEPLGLLYLAATLRDRGHAVRLVDGAIETESAILDTVQAWRPGVVGISSMKHSWPVSQRLAARIRRARPSTTIVLGGPQATCWQQECLEECPDLDIAVVGEGEETLVELCASLESGTCIETIRGLIWRDAGRIRTNPPRDPVTDLDGLPYPAHDLIDAGRYRPSVGFYNTLPSLNMITSRGCSFRCTFCAPSHPLRLRSVDDILTELERMVWDYGARHVTFYDEGITDSGRRITQLCQGMMDRGLGLSWCANARVDQVNRDILATMREAGCWKLLYGLESGVQKNLDAVNKGIRLEQSREAVRATRDAGIETFGTFMFGIPGETFDEGLQTIAFACDLGLDYAAFLNLVPYKGSHIHANLARYGRLTGNWSTNLISFVPHSMTIEQMAKLNTLAAKRFFGRPTYLFRRLRTMRSTEDLKRNVRGFLAYNRLTEADFLDRPDATIDSRRGLCSSEAPADTDTCRDSVYCRGTRP